MLCITSVSLKRPLISAGRVRGVRGPCKSSPWRWSRDIESEATFAMSGEHEVKISRIREPLQWFKLYTNAFAISCTIFSIFLITMVGFTYFFWKNTANFPCYTVTETVRQREFLQITCFKYFKRRQLPVWTTSQSIFELHALHIHTNISAFSSVIHIIRPQLLQLSLALTIPTSFKGSIPTVQSRTRPTSIILANSHHWQKMPEQMRT